MNVRFNPTTNTIDVTLDGVTHKLPYIIAEQMHRTLGIAIEQMDRTDGDLQGQSEVPV